MLWTRELTRGGPGVNGRFALAHAEWAFRIKKDNVNQSECVKMGDLNQGNLLVLTPFNPNTDQLLYSPY